MLTLYRGLVAALLVAGLAVLGDTPTRAQAKKDDKAKDPVVKKEPLPPKKDPAKDDTRDRTVSFATSDGLALSGYWFQGAALEKQPPDAVLMFPAPGNKVTDTWIELARQLSRNNFSVLLFDWRGSGMNGPEAGSRIFESPERFWNEHYNIKLLKPMKARIDEKGLDYNSVVTRTDQSGIAYKDWFLNDLMGARFFLDKQNDNGKCNTNRVWIVSEKDGANLGLAFIAAEFQRNSIYNPKPELLQGTQSKPAGKDYVGLTALSYSTGGVFATTAQKVFRNALPEGNRGPDIREARSHLEQRLAMVLLYSKAEGPSASRSLVSRVHGGTTEDVMKRNFKYLREIDTKTSKVSGIGMIDAADSFKAREEVIRAMSEISKDKQTIGKERMDREANKMTTVPRFPIEGFSRNR